MCEITEYPRGEAAGGYSASELPGSVAGVDTVANVALHSSIQYIDVKSDQIIEIENEWQDQKVLCIYCKDQ